LPLRGIALILFGEVEGAKPGAAPGPDSSLAFTASSGRPKPAVSQAELRGITRERALEQARTLLFEKVKETPLLGNTTIGSRIQRDPVLAAYVRGAVENAHVEKVAYPDGRTCEATLSLDVLPLVRRLAEIPR